MRSGDDEGMFERIQRGRVFLDGSIRIEDSGVSLLVAGIDRARCWVNEYLVYGREIEIASLRRTRYIKTLVHVSDAQKKGGPSRPWDRESFGSLGQASRRRRTVFALATASAASVASARRETSRLRRGNPFER